MTRLITFILFLTQLLWSLRAQPKYPGVYQITEPVDHAETPIWDTRNNILYYVNIHQGQVFRYNPATNDLKFITLDGEVAPAIPSQQDPNLLIIGLNRSVAAVEWDGVSPPSQTRILDTVSQQFPTSRFNDGKADQKGRLWIGTMGHEDSDGTLTPNQGVLYKVTCNFSAPEVILAPVNISNGLAWNAANNRFFYIDTPSGQVVAYSYDNEAGEISDKQVVFDVRNYADKITGGPDGMTIDEDDNLWVALYGGGAVIKVNSTTGELMQTVPIPALDITSAMWGGQDLDVLYVTTSRIGLSAQQRLEQPAAGAVFAVTGLGTKGKPTFGVDIIGSIDDQDCE